MIPSVEQHRDQLAELCRRYHVQRLEIFGSAVVAQDEDDPRDLDFLVAFHPTDGMGPADQYFGLLESLSALFDRPVDLVCSNVIRNPYFLREINRSRVELYAA